MTNLTGARQPLLSHLAVAVAAPTCALSAPGGDMGASAIEGLFCDDRRLLSYLTLQVGGQPVEVASYAATSPAAVSFVGLVNAEVADAVSTVGITMDAPLWASRTRTVTPNGMREHLEVHSGAGRAVTTTAVLAAATDGVGMFQARLDMPGPLLAPQMSGEVTQWELAEGTLHLRAPGAVATLRGDVAEFLWTVHLAPGGSWAVDVDIEWDGFASPQTDQSLTSHPYGSQASPQGGLLSAQPAASAGGPDALAVATASGTYDALLARSVADLAALTRTDGTEGYISAGVPWYLTLFGRDSLWTARMALPLGTATAMSTLRALAARQGTRVDPATGEEPGKILHELRREAVRGALPAVYYGTVDATPLWIVTLERAWAWGAPAAQVAELLPCLTHALTWLLEYADADGDGLVDYLSADIPGALANQGWKDSSDAIHDRSGRLARGRVALVEVQGYAYQAALAAAALLEAASAGELTGCDPAVLVAAPAMAARARGYAAALADRFREAFWVRSGPVPYPATAVVHPSGRPDAETWLADSVTSNMGHLLGTGILNAQEAGWVARWLADPALTSDFGLRTLAATSERYHPLSYHNGSVWPHDTAIAVEGLVAEGHADAAARLAQGLVAAADVFDNRLPELWGGQSLGGPGGSSLRPIPYPTACAPQAWAAGSALALLSAAVGLCPDIPHGRVVLRPPARALLGACAVRGLVVGGRTWILQIDAYGNATVLDAPAGIEVTIEQPRR